MSINIFGVVGDDVRASDIITKVQSMSEDVVEINIMSPGGSVVEGLAIYDFLKNSDKKVITRAMGQAASIASVIFMAGDEREVADNAEIMIHNAWAGVAGNKHEMVEYAERLEIIDQKLINIYASRTNLNEDQVRALLDKETFMSADEAVNSGFATSKTDAMALVAQYQSIENINKEPNIMAENKQDEVVKAEASESKEKSFFAHMLAYFKNEEMPEEEPEAMEEEHEEEAKAEGEEVAPEEEAKAEDSEEEPEAMEEEESPEALKAKIQDLENQLAEAKAKAESVPKTVKEESINKAGLILDAMSDDKITMHEAKNLCADSLEDVKAALDKKESNATGRGKVEDPKAEARGNVYDEYSAISDPAERNAFFNKHKDEIIKLSKES